MEPRKQRRRGSDAGRRRARFSFLVTRQARHLALRAKLSRRSVHQSLALKVAVLSREERLAGANKGPGRDAQPRGEVGRGRLLGRRLGDADPGLPHRRRTACHILWRIRTDNGLAHGACVCSARARAASAQQPTVDTFLVELMIAGEPPKHVSGLEGLQADGAAGMARGGVRHRHGLEQRHFCRLEVPRRSPQLPRQVQLSQDSTAVLRF
mmetsp:Transcript_5637/g.22163  ORF Transcript_5637/g.22163 Transcript_5637/m.22163 type:complete len:210 (-) Transcript_5637:672-1301(-)